MTAGERLYEVERELERISVEQHALATAKATLTETATALRLSMKHEDRVCYEALKLRGRPGLEVPSA